MRTRKASPEIDPALLSEEVQSRIRSNAATWHRHTCKLATPMYGGGVTPNGVDRAMPIRATAIRGQLRFRWRLLDRHQPEHLGADGKPDSGRLLVCQRKIGEGLCDRGSLAASPMAVRVESPSAEGKTGPKGGSALGRRIVPYSGVSVDWLPCTHPFGLVLSLRIDVGEDSVLPASRMCAGFGGMGARRRRGLGQQSAFDAQGKRVFFGKTDCAAGKTQLYVMAGNGRNDYREVVEAGVRYLIDFRQKRSLARGLGAGHCGSYWSEANAVRELAERARPKNPHALEVADDGSTLHDRFATPLIHRSAYSTSEGRVPATDFDSPVPAPQIAMRGTFHFVIEDQRLWTQLARHWLEKGFRQNGIGGKRSSSYGHFSDVKS
jgi:CRISPR-associated protein Cmr1